MELILTTNNESSIAKIITLAKKLNVTIEQRGNVIESEKEELGKRILNFKANETSSFGDATEWQRNERQDRDLSSS